MSNLHIRSRAPLRIGLAGGGTDVSPYSDKFGSAILNATISMYAYTTISPSPKEEVVFRSADIDLQERYELGSIIPSLTTLQLHCGVYRRMIKDFNNNNPLSLTVNTHCDAPPGSGLGSSSAIVVSMIVAYVKFLRLNLNDYEIANLAYQIERIDLGLQGGFQDHYAAAFGGINYIEFDGGSSGLLVNALKVKNEILAEFEASLVLFFTGISRDSAHIIEDQIKNIKSEDTSSLAAMHQLKYDASLMKKYLLKGNIRQMAQVLGHSWETKKQLSNRISNSFIEDVYSAAMDSGALAGKISGAGGGGFMFFFVDPISRSSVCKALLSKSNGLILPVYLSRQGATSWNFS